MNVFYMTKGISTFYTNRVIFVVGAKLRLTNIVLKRLIGIRFSQSNGFLRVKIKPGYVLLIGKEVKLVVSFLVSKPRNYCFIMAQDMCVSEE